MNRRFLIATIFLALASRAFAHDYGKLPMSFEENGGQANRQVKFQARGEGYQVFLTPGGATIALREGTKLRRGSHISSASAYQSDALGLEFVGSDPGVKIVGEGQLPGRSNYLIGSDPHRWHTQLRNYSRVSYEAIYPSTDLVFYGNARELEFDLVLAPGADPNAIKIKLTGAQELRLDNDGNIVLRTSGRDILLRAPFVYQKSIASRKRIPAQFVLSSANEISFHIAAYDASKELVIDPVLSYATYLGGATADEFVLNLTADRTGNAYAVGSTCSTDFPTSHPAQPAAAGNCDVFVSKLDPTGTHLLYSTYLGGSGGDTALGVAVDRFGNAYVTGQTFSSDFPLKNALQAHSGGDVEAFVAELNPTGSKLVYSTYLGGSGFDNGLDIAVDRDGSAAVVGETNSTNFPTRKPFQGSLRGSFNAFITKLKPGGNGLVYSTYLGGTGEDHGYGIALDNFANAYVTGFTNSSDFPTTRHGLQRTLAGGFDAFAAKLNSQGSGLVYSTYLGGAADENGLDVGVDWFGSAHLTGQTCSPDFPTRNPAQASLNGGCNAYVSRLDPTGSVLIYSTYLGGSVFDFARGIATQNVLGPLVFDYVGGFTCSPDFPLARPVQSTAPGGCEAFVAKLGPFGGIVYSTYLGGSDFDQVHGVGVDALGNAYVGGGTCSLDFPTTPNAFQTVAPGNCTEGFVAKITDPW